MPSEQLEVEVTKGPNGGSILRLTGPLTLTGVFKFQAICREQTAGPMIIDMTAVPYADSAGIGSLVLAHVSCQKTGRKLVLAGVGPRPKEVMRITRVDQVLTMTPTLEEAEQRVSSAA
ncbi:MAG: STAS domain-containing protein [Acidobacteria bacterium]|nr:STAS domain-containing protein [Acidobacteriota bacterium]